MRQLNDGEKEIERLGKEFRIANTLMEEVRQHISKRQRAKLPRVTTQVMNVKANHIRALNNQERLQQELQILKDWEINLQRQDPDQSPGPTTPGEMHPTNGPTGRAHSTQNPTPAHVDRDGRELDTPTLQMFQQTIEVNERRYQARSDQMETSMNILCGAVATIAEKMNTTGPRVLPGNITPTHRPNPTRRR